MKSLIGKAMWYLGLGYLISVLSFAVIGLLNPDDPSWTSPYFVQMFWYQKVAYYFYFIIVVSHIILIGPLIVVSAVIGAVLFCLMILVKKVASFLNASA